MFEAVEKEEVPNVSQLPKKSKGKLRKKIKFVSPRQKGVKVMMCPKLYTLVKWWAKTSHQYISQFIQNAIMDAFVREIQECEHKIKLMEKYYNEYVVCTI